MQKAGSKRADYVDLHVILSRPIEGSLGEHTGDTLSLEGFWNLSVNKFQYMPRDRVFQIGDVPVALNFKAPFSDNLGDAFFFAKKSHQFCIAASKLTLEFYCIREGRMSVQMRNCWNKGMNDPDRCRCPSLKHRTAATLGD